MKFNETRLKGSGYLGRTQKCYRRNDGGLTERRTDDTLHTSSWFEHDRSL